MVPLVGGGNISGTLVLYSEGFMELVALMEKGVEGGGWLGRGHNRI